MAGKRNNKRKVKVKLFFYVFEKITKLILVILTET